MKKIGLILFILILSFTWAIAQSTITKGIVLSGDNGEPLPGASVVVTGTDISVVTDMNGQFSIEVPSGYLTLTVSYTGMEPVIVDVNPGPIVLVPKTTKKIEWGVRLGMNINKIYWTYEGVEDDEMKSKVGFNLGGACSVNLTRKLPLFVETGLYLQYKGAKEKGGDGDESYEGKYKIWYLEIPAVLSYHIDIDRFTVQPFAGVYYALGIGGKMKGSYTYQGVTETDKEDLFGKDENGDYNYFKRSDFGLRFGCGLAYESIYFGLGYDLGLTNISQFDNEESKNRSFFITLGYNF